MNNLVGQDSIQISSESLFDRLHYQKIVDLTLKAEFKSLELNKYQKKYKPARLYFKDAEGNQQDWQLKIRPRGRSRIGCGRPPLMLKFKKKELIKNGFTTDNKFKMVTTCSKCKIGFREMMLFEYLCYLIFNELTDQSFRVQLLRLKYEYIDIGVNTNHWGFLLESPTEWANRNEAEWIEPERVNLDDYKQEALYLVNIFQYFIYNSDWHPESLQNIKIFQKKGKVIPIPYDFDQSLLVKKLNKKKNRRYSLQRWNNLFLSTNADKELLRNTYEIFYNKRESLIGIVENFDLLLPELRELAILVLHNFYDRIENPEL